ncbi:hypothetical protein M405DRAFT_399617 [Rhizopogon salebrosus TDB-379]|nr:hypothetical protein M405DRAFT_399617 [Rhizopogon salebrosus TDB-379]
MIYVVRHEQQLDLCKQSIDRFNEDRKLIPPRSTRTSQSTSAVSQIGLWGVCLGRSNLRGTSRMPVRKSKGLVTRVVNLLISLEENWSTRLGWLTVPANLRMTWSLAQMTYFPPTWNSRKEAHTTRDTIPVMHEQHMINELMPEKQAVMHEKQVTHGRQFMNDEVVHEQQVIAEYQLGLQSAVDFTGKLSKDVSVYVRDLVGSWHWSFDSTPYF